MNARFLYWLAGLGILAGHAFAAPTVSVTQGEEESLAATFDTADLIQDLLPEELPGDQGWYPANTDPADQLPAFTDGLGLRVTGMTGLLADYPGTGNPAKRIQYALRAPVDISEVRIFSGNNGRDGRVFHTYTVRFSTDGAVSFSEPLYVQSHASGTLNNGAFNQWRAVLSQLSDSEGWLATRVSHIWFDFYAVDNTGGQMRDPFDGPNPFTGPDDGLSPAFVSPLIWEIDVLGSYSQPILSATRQGNSLIFSWVGLTNGAVIQATTNLSLGDWQNLNPQPAITSVGNTNQAAVAIQPGGMFMRVKY